MKPEETEQPEETTKSDSKPTSTATEDSPFKGVHWKTAIGTVILCTSVFGFIAKIWMETDAKMDELRIVNLEQAEKRISELEKTESELAATKVKYETAQKSLDQYETSYQQLLDQNFEQKFKAELARSKSLKTELEALKENAGEIEPNMVSEEIKTLQDKLAIVETERDQLRELYTNEKSKLQAINTRQTAPKDNSKTNVPTPVQPKPRGDNSTRIEALKVAVEEMVSSDARDTIISGVKAAGGINASDLAEMYEPLLVSSDQLAVILAIGDLIYRPINAKDMKALTTGMVSSHNKEAMIKLNSR